MENKKSKTKKVLFSLILFFSINLNAQYPIIKKIGKDSLILMTLKQGDDINKSFTKHQKKLDSLKDSIDGKRFIIDSLNIEFNKLEKRKEEYKLRYEERLNMPMIKYQYHNDSWEFAQKMVLIGIIVLQFFTIR